VSDDEAFIRRVVDSPGDDTPRLVYADWLDERGDQRGAYLRAELEVLAADDIGGLKALRLTAVNVAGLDPVWVARVSRPPIGVCCDHLTLSATDDRVQASDLDEAGADLGVGLPPQLRALLLNYSLGNLKGGPFVMPRPGNGKNLAIDGFVCLIDPELTDGHVSHELVDHTEWLREEFGLDPEYLYLASTFDDAALVVSGRRSDLGSVHLTDGYEMQTNPGSGVNRIADSVGEFLAMLRPRTWPLTDADV
jgi:uncharacterized protein (TIGR02996 family)